MPSKIVINGNSWHYKIYNWTWHTEPGDLCSYVRGIFTSFLWWSLKTLVILSLAIGFLLCMIGVIYIAFRDLNRQAVWIVLGFMGGIVAIALCVAGIGWCVQNYWMLSYAVEDAMKKRRTTSLIYAYLKAKKEKYCPLVEVEYNKENKRA